MTTLKTVEEVENELRARLNMIPHHLDRSKMRNLIKRIRKTDRATIAAVLKERLEVIKPNYVEHQEDCLIRYNKKKGCSCGVKQNNSATYAIDQAIAIIDEVLTSEAKSE